MRASSGRPCVWDNIVIMAERFCVFTKVFGDLALDISSYLSFMAVGLYLTNLKRFPGVPPDT